MIKINVEDEYKRLAQPQAFESTQGDVAAAILVVAKVIQQAAEPEIINQEEPKKWLIWSMEHEAWWRPAHAGYTERIDEAGRYSYQDALEIVYKANRYVAKKPNEAMILDA